MSDAMPPTHPFWGEIHTHTDLSDGNGSPEDNFEIALSHLDFWAMADHAFDPAVFSRNYKKEFGHPYLLNDRWEHIQELCRSYEDPGKFIPFLAYEWTNYQFGHHNVYYLDYDQPIRMPPTLPELYDSVRGVDAFVIPHHGGYPVGVCGKDWDCHDDQLTPFVEIYSLHGSSEEPAGIRPLLTPGSWMGPGGAGGSVQDGLARGHRLGIMASSDSHFDHPGAYDNGLIAAYSDELTRPSLWEAFRNRRVYGVTGDRIGLDFRIDGQPMGSILRGAGARAIEVSVAAWDKVDRVDVLKNNAILHSFVEPAGRAEPASEHVRLRFMLEWGWDAKATRDWECRLEAPGGKVLRAIPCYRRGVAGRVGRGVVSLSRGECCWTSQTEQFAGGKMFRHAADAMAFEVECDRAAELRISFACGGLVREWTASPAQIFDAAAVTYMEPIPPTNDGSHWRQMDVLAKVKQHQGWPVEPLTLDLAYEDEAAGARQGQTDFYYVRVVQQNGQRAWSSPIWVS